jgi:hypothetical protein
MLASARWGNWRGSAVFIDAQASDFCIQHTHERPFDDFARGWEKPQNWQPKRGAMVKMSASRAVKWDKYSKNPARNRDSARGVEKTINPLEGLKQIHHPPEHNPRDRRKDHQPT